MIVKSLRLFVSFSGPDYTDRKFLGISVVTFYDLVPYLTNRNKYNASAKRFTVK